MMKKVYPRTGDTQAIYLNKAKNNKLTFMTVYFNKQMEDCNEFYIL